MEKKIEKTFFVSETIVFEMVAFNCLYEEENACLQQSMG